MSSRSCVYLLCSRLPDPEPAAPQARPAAPLARRGTAEWETQAPADGGQRVLAAPAANGGSHTGALSPQSYFSLSPQQQQQELYRQSGGEPALRAACGAPNGPFETDIDEFRDEMAEDEEPVGTETQCFARPVTVLETDIDTLPEAEEPPAAAAGTPCGSLAEDGGSRTRAGLKGELFPHSAEGEASGETWRGGRSVLELSVDTLER